MKMGSREKWLQELSNPSTGNSFGRKEEWCNPSCFHVNFLGKKIGILNDNDDSFKRDGNGPSFFKKLSSKSDAVQLW